MKDYVITVRLVDGSEVTTEIDHGKLPGGARYIEEAVDVMAEEGAHLRVTGGSPVYYPPRSIYSIGYSNRWSVSQEEKAS